MTVRTISSNEAKQRWGSMISAASEQGDEIVVESHGKPKVAVISYEDYQEFAELREKRRREEALAWLRDFEREYGGRNADLTEEEIEGLANRATHKAFDELAAEGKLVFERDRK